MELPPRLPDRRGSRLPQPGEAHPPDGEERRAVKLRLPMDQVMKLHTLRILENEPISQVVEAALNDYFARQRARRAALADDQSPE